MKILDTYALPHMERTGFDSDLNDEERASIESVHRFASEVMRPAGLALDRMSGEEVIAPTSPLWAMFASFGELGIDQEMFDSLEPAAAARLESLIYEELGWGDVGLALSLAAAGFPAQVAAAVGNTELMALCEGKIGCWPVTQPDAGCDMLDVYGTERHPESSAHKGNLVARFVGDEIIISGQTAAWISNGTIAQVAALCVPADYGDGIIGADGNPNRAVIIVPLDGPCVSRGKPLDKIGQIPLPQGEIFFDELRVPRSYAVCQNEAGRAGFLSILAHAGVFMAQVFTGLARASFENALAYAHERKQGGVELAQHQSVRYRLGEMYKKVEICRAMSRRAAHYLHTVDAPHASVSSTSKVVVTQNAFEVATEAVKLMGGAGLTSEYPAEKLLRDASSALIADGENFFLTQRLGSTICELYQAGWAND